MGEIITFKQKGDFHKLYNLLEKGKELIGRSRLDQFGAAGVEALQAATPIDTGKTAALWTYKVEMGVGRAKLSFHNTNINNGVPIAIILQYGHATGNGGWVEGRDYINPALKPIFDKIAGEVWKEARGL